MPDHDALERVARRAVAAACRVARKVQLGSADVRAITKDDRSPVTVADFAAQAVVAHALRSELGADVCLVAEESSSFLRDAEHASHLQAALEVAHEVWPHASADALLGAIDLGAGDPCDEGFWTLDPIDGTKGFMRGQQYAISLAWVEGGVPVVGVLGCPNLPRGLDRPLDAPDAHGCLYASIRGKGVREMPADAPDDAPREIRRDDDDPDRPISVCASVEKAHSNVGDTDRVLQRVGQTREPTRIDSQAKYAVVARGQADAYLRLPTKRGYVERIWDHAAGSLVAIEAGCAVTDVFGRSLDFTHGRGLEKNKGIVCAPPHVHGKLVDAIAELGIGRDA